MQRRSAVPSTAQARRQVSCAPVHLHLPTSMEQPNCIQGTAGWSWHVMNCNGCISLGGVQSAPSPTCWPAGSDQYVDADSTPIQNIWRCSVGYHLNIRYNQGCCHAHDEVVGGLGGSSTLRSPARQMQVPRESWAVSSLWPGKGWSYTCMASAQAASTCMPAAAMAPGVVGKVRAVPVGLPLASMKMPAWSCMQYTCITIHPEPKYMQPVMAAGRAVILLHSPTCLGCCDGRERGGQGPLLRCESCQFNALLTCFCGAAGVWQRICCHQVPSACGRC